MTRQWDEDNNNHAGVYEHCQNSTAKNVSQNTSRLLLGASCKIAKLGEVFWAQKTKHHGSQGGKRITNEKRRKTHGLSRGGKSQTEIAIDRSLRHMIHGAGWPGLQRWKLSLIRSYIIHQPVHSLLCNYIASVSLDHSRTWRCITSARDIICDSRGLGFAFPNKDNRLGVCVCV